MNIFNRFFRVLPAAALLLALAPSASAAGWPGFNDSMFPPAPSARSVINIDGKGFIIHGKRTYIVAGEVQYPRIPRALWRDRLLRIKRAGYNTIQTYVYWNYHEPREGQFDFSGEKDLNAFLKTVQSLGMYAIVRPGPYVNAEWDTGGLPVWLRFKPGLLPLTDNPQFYAAVTPYWNKVFPIIVKNQITQGGPVIMVQLDNEHTHDGLGRGIGSGTDLPDAFYRHYRQVAVKAGVVVPYFFSGLNHSDDPAGDGPLDTASRTTPWYSTEFWTGWYGWYGVSPEKQRKVVRATWKILAYGGAGYTHYTMAGGSDFETWNNNEQAASYDFGSPIGQAGDFRSDYYPLKRAALFAAAFPKVLADSVASEGGSAVTPTNANVRLTRRTGKAGSIMFLDNPGYRPRTVQLKAADGTLTPAAGPIRMEPGEIVPVVTSYPLLPTVTLTLGAARILGTATQGRTTTLVIYGAPGEPGELHFRVPASGVTLAPSAGAMTAAKGTVTLKTTFPASAPRVFSFQAGAQTVRVLAEPSALADRTWFVPVGGQTQIVCGPEYVGEAALTGGRLALQTEQNGLVGPPAGASVVFTANTQTALVKTPTPGKAAASATPPALGAWQADLAVPQAQPGFNDTKWLAVPAPRPMGADGDSSAFAWYRTTLTAPTTGTYQLDISDYSDWVTAFVDGKRVGSGDVHRTTSDDLVPRPQSARLTVPLTAGPHTLALFAAHYGRNKLVTYYGPLDTIDSKGVTGPVTLALVSGQAQDLPTFRWKADDGGVFDADTQAAPGLDTAGADWQDAHPYDDVFHDRIGSAWFRAVLPDVPGPHRRLTFASVDDLGTVYLNGTQIASGIGINANVTVDLDAAWRTNGPNVLAVLVQNTAQGGGLGKVTLTGGLTDGAALTGWRMRGGEPVPEAAAWKPLAAGAAPGVPAWYQAEFTANPPGPNGPHPALRVQTSTLTRGEVWLNGHNLGRYPEVSRDNSGGGPLVDGVYLPECWLKPGRNRLMIFDEEGAAPAGVKVIIEQAASRRDVFLTSAGQ